MTIAEAVEIRRNWQQHPADRVNTADHVIVREYLRLTDPTPLTREVIENELGEPLYEWCWKVGRARITYSKWSGRVDLNGSLALTTLGDLRWLVAKLRGGGE